MSNSEGEPAASMWCNARPVVSGYCVPLPRPSCRKAHLPQLHATHAHHELADTEVPLRGDTAVELASAAQAVMTPFTEVRHRSRDVVVLDYHEVNAPGGIGSGVAALCTTVSIDRHWMTLRRAELFSHEAAPEEESPSELSLYFCPASTGRGPSLSPVASSSAPPARGGVKRISREGHGRSVSRWTERCADSATDAHEVDEPPSCHVYSTRWRHGDALLLTDEDDLVRVWRAPQDPTRVTALSRGRLFSVGVSDDCASAFSGNSSGGGSGPLRSLSTCALTDDITVNALCATHWGPFTAVVGSSDGSLKVVDWRVPSRSAVVLDTTTPQPVLGGRRHAACVLSCCTLGEGNFRVVCGLGAPNGEVAVADLRRPELSETALRSRRVLTKAGAAKRALLGGVVCAPTGSPIADMQLLPHGSLGGRGAAGRTFPSLSIVMVDVCGAVVVMSVADLESQRVGWSGRRSRRAPTLSCAVHEEDEEGEEEEAVAPTTAAAGSARRAFDVPPPPRMTNLARQTVTPPHEAVVDVVVVADDEEAENDSEERTRSTARARTLDVSEFVDAADLRGEASTRRRTVFFSSAAPGAGRLPSPEAVASAWPWRPTRDVTSRSPSFIASSPTVRPAGTRRGEPSLRAGSRAHGTGTLSAWGHSSVRSQSLPPPAWPAQSPHSAVSVATPAPTMIAAPSVRPSPQPSLGVLSSTELRCAVVSGAEWSGRRDGGSLVVSTQPSSAATTWYDPTQQEVLGELVPLLRGGAQDTAEVLQQGHYIVSVDTLGPLVCVETAGGGTYCLLPQQS